jgi:hypothetical protein
MRSWLQGLLGGVASPSRSAETTTVASGRVVSERFFEVSPELAQKLRGASANQPPDDVELKLDAFLLDPGLGPATYLTRDGRIVWDSAGLWGPIEPSLHEAYLAIVVGASKTGLTELLELLPRRTSDAINCRECRGTGWFEHELMRDTEGQPFRPVCHACSGLGWRRGVVMLPTDVAAWLKERISAFEQEAPEPLRWLAPHVAKHRALPLLVEWTETAGLRADGALVWWSTENDYVGLRPVHDARERNIVVVEGTKRYPFLASIVPARPSNAVECPHCHGDGRLAEPPENVICYCGGLGWLPPECSPR